MLPYPQIDPVAIALGPLKIHWYGLMYLVGIGGAWWLASRRLERGQRHAAELGDTEGYRRHQVEVSGPPRRIDPA